MDTKIIGNRINILKEKMLKEERYVSIEQARIITRVYQENESLSIPKKRALSLYTALRELEISVEKEELIVGNRTKGVRGGVVFPESGCSWVMNEIDDIPTRPQDRFKVREEDSQEFKTQIYPYWAHRSMEDIIKRDFGEEINAIAKVVKINQKDHAQGHICPDCETWLKKGPRGLIEDIKVQKQNATADQIEFYECSELVLEGVICFMKRYHDLIMQMEFSDDLKNVAKICDNLTKRPPNTFHEAVQSLWFLFVVLHMESNASSFSPGRIDQYLYPYYKKDINDNKIDSSKALEIIECLYLKFNQIVYLRNKHSAQFFAGFPIGFNIAIGGIDALGNNADNEISELCLKAQYDLGLPQPNLSVRLHKDTPEILLKNAVRVVARGSGMPQFFNDEAIINSLINDLNIDPIDAKNYAIVGCVELTTQGNNLGWSDAAMFNFNKVLELTMNHGRCLITGEQLATDLGGLDTYSTFDELEIAYKQHIDEFIEKMMEAEIHIEKAHQQCLPTAFLSTVIDNCIEKGMDVTRGGAKYNLSGIQMIQIANLADSLAAIKQFVYEEKSVDQIELLQALKNDFENSQVLRAKLLNKAPKYGNDIEWVDQLGIKWAEYFRERMKDYTNYRGGSYHTGMYTVSAHVPMGENVGASPDGRYSQTPLADGGMSPVYGRDKNGPTAILKSVSRINNSLTTNGGLLNMKFLPQFFKNEVGIEKFSSLLRAFVQLKIPHIQFNVVNKEDLLDAKCHPDLHSSLTIRVAGYTAYFVELASQLQDEIIERTSYDDI